jgi:hypothetical protein
VRAEMLVMGICNPTGEQDAYNGLYFTQTELLQLKDRMRGVAVKTEHAGAPIGQVLSGFVDASGNLHCVMELEQRSLPGALAQGFIRDGVAAELSLGYTVDIKNHAHGLKATEKKKQEAEAGEDGKKKDDGKKRPNSKIAEKLREEQARRALEEKAAITAAELLDEATRLFKCIDVLNLGEKALKRLDSAEVSADVVELVARGAQALEDFPGFESITKIDAIIAQLQLRMDNFLKLEERRRIKREKEKAKKEEMRAAGLLLSAKEREKLKRQEAFLASLGKADEGADAHPRAYLRKNSNADLSFTQSEPGRRSRTGQKIVGLAHKKGGRK